MALLSGTQDENAPNIFPDSGGFNPDFLGAFSDLAVGYSNYDGTKAAAAFFDNDLQHGALTLYRLREGVERDLTDPNAESPVTPRDIWVMADHIRYGNPTVHNVKRGCNVLYMDGHVQFVDYLSKPPASNAWSQFDAYVGKL